jgi:hypothetical protein
VGWSVVVEPALVVGPFVVSGADVVGSVVPGAGVVVLGAGAGRSVPVWVVVVVVVTGVGGRMLR